MVRGQCFDHKYWIDVETGKPLRCVVTAFRHGMVYYKVRLENGQLGVGAKFPENRWPDYVKVPTRKAD